MRYGEKLAYWPEVTQKSRDLNPGQSGKGGSFWGQEARTCVAVQLQGSHRVPLGLSFPICYMGKERSQLDPLPLPPSAGLLAWNLTAMVHPGALQRPYSGGPGNSQSVPTLG